MTQGWYIMIRHAIKPTTYPNVPTNSIECSKLDWLE